MKKSDFIYLLSKNLEDYSEIDISLSADLIQNTIIESLKKRNRIEIRGFGSDQLTDLCPFHCNLQGSWKADI